MDLTADSIVVAREHTDAKIGEEIVILGAVRSRYYGVQGVGARIWQLVQAPVSMAEVQRTIVAEYDVTPEQCAADLLGLVRHMIAEGLVEVRQAGAAPG